MHVWNDWQGGAGVEREYMNLAIEKESASNKKKGKPKRASLENRVLSFSDLFNDSEPTTQESNDGNESNNDTHTESEENDG